MFGLTLGVLILAGCGGAQAVPTATPVPSIAVPTPTPVPPTATTEPPTTTLAPPTHTLVAPSATPRPTHTPAPPTATPTPQLPSRILFIGDSDAFWLDQHLKKLAASADPPLVIETSGVTGGGMSLEEHWQLLGLKAVREGNWDVVVLNQDVAAHWSDIDKFYEYAGKFDQEIQKVGAQTVLYMPQPFKKEIDPLLTTEDYAAVYDKLGAELGDKVAPAALAWQRSMQERPNLELYARDEARGNLHGTYLTLCVLYATIFELSPVGLAYHYDVPFGSVEFNMRRMMEDMKDWKTITDDEAAFLQSVAWETVQEYETPQ
jgi:hypothetical protein